MSDADISVAESRICKSKPVVVAHHQSAQCYFCPETEELVFIADSEAAEFEAHWKEMQQCVNDFHQEKINYSVAIEKYGIAAEATAAPEASFHDAVVRAEEDLELKRKELKEKIGEFSIQGMKYNDVVELVPVSGQSAKRKAGEKRAPVVYVKKGYYSQGKDGRKLHTVSLKSRDKKGGAESIFERRSDGKIRRIDDKKLKRQLAGLNWPKIKFDLKDVVKWAGLVFDPEALSMDCSLFDWADSWNAAAQGEAKWGDHIDFEGGAQFMRFVSNFGANVEIDPRKQQFSIKGEGGGSLTAAAGIASFSIYAPDRIGWALTVNPSDENEVPFDLGMMRLSLNVRLAAFIGATLQVEAQFQVVSSGDQQTVMGQPGRLRRFSERRSRAYDFHQQMNSEDEGIKLSAEAFAGARAEGTLTGSLQWLKPTAAGETNGGILETTGEYVDFCKIGPSIAGLAGMGAGLSFYCTFINGKFCFRFAASLCKGLGAKGGFICEVNGNTFLEFGAWLIYQLNERGYGFFRVMDAAAFDVYTKCCVMQMEVIEKNVYEYYSFAKSPVERIKKEFGEVVRELADEAKNSVEASTRRNQLARNIIERETDLLRYTPEAKGILLYLLTRHGKWDNIDPGNIEFLDRYGERKEAVLCVLRSIQTKPEWHKVLSRVNSQGNGPSEGYSELDAVERHERSLVDFLKLGEDRDRELYKIKYERSELAIIYDRLKEFSSSGYALAMNDTVYYKLNVGRNPNYPRRCKFGPCGADVV
ncbi:ATPase [Pseudomonas putida]|uniref:ATPase n=1 Tax=Pseudomonas putida TaxID=303 RepID=A0A7Y7ZEU5_PSEPU|nr:ATPase [Pseudomonas putida]NWC83671.1 ATPase [Pseudomonas putida]